MKRHFKMNMVDFIQYKVIDSWSWAHLIPTRGREIIKIIFTTHIYGRLNFVLMSRISARGSLRSMGICRFGTHSYKSLPKEGLSISEKSTSTGFEFANLCPQCELITLRLAKCIVYDRRFKLKKLFYFNNYSKNCPLILISYTINFNTFFIFIIISSVLVGTIGGYNQT